MSNDKYLNHVIKLAQTGDPAVKKLAQEIIQGWGNDLSVPKFLTTAKALSSGTLKGITSKVMNVND